MSNEVILADGLEVLRSGRVVLSLKDSNVLRLQVGGMIAVIGPNGAGKSTLLRALAGLSPPSNGCVRLNGRLLYALSPVERAELIGYLPQTLSPAWDYTGREMIDLQASRNPRNRRSADAIATEMNVEALLEQRWSRMSGGERARIALAGVLAAEAAVLLADEPAASLDVQHRHHVLKELARHADSKVVLVVMHDLDLAMAYCSRILLLANGVLIEDGTPMSLVSTGILDRIFGVRFQKANIDVRLGPALAIGAPTVI
jgi:iron complex transport system ATP-binding protein